MGDFRSCASKDAEIAKLKARIVAADKEAADWRKLVEAGDRELSTRSQEVWAEAAKIARDYAAQNAKTRERTNKQLVALRGTSMASDERHETLERCEAECEAAEHEALAIAQAIEDRSRASPDIGRATDIAERFPTIPKQP